MSRAKYQQIASEIARRIDEGHYPLGAKLPAHRVMAKEFSTTAVTISKAYQLLVEQHRVESFVGRGSYVRDDRLQQVIGADEGNWNFSILQPCMAHNLQPLQQAFSAALARERGQNFGYSEETGSAEHRAAAAQWSQHYGLASLEREMLLCGGAQQALSALITHYTKPGDAIAVERYTYPGLLAIIRHLKRRAVAVDIDTQGMCPLALAQSCQEQPIKMAVLVPSQQNPTGCTMGVERRQKLAGVVEQCGLWLVEDAIYAFLDAEPLPAVANFAPSRSFHISSLSKAISPGIRCGFLSVPRAQMASFCDVLRALHWMPAALPFAAATELIRSGAAFELAETQRAIAQRRQVLLAQALHGLEFSSGASSYSCWLTLPQAWRADSFTRAATARGMSVSAGDFFAVEAQGSRQVRLSVMGIADDASYARALAYLRALLDSEPVPHWHC